MSIQITKNLINMAKKQGKQSVMVPALPKLSKEDLEALEAEGYVIEDKKLMLKISWT